MLPKHIQQILDNYAKEYRCKDWFDFRFKHSPENIMSIHFEQIIEEITKHYESIHPKRDWDDKTTDMIHDENTIKGFTTSEYRFLSNFFPCTVVFEGRIFSSSEAAYQSAKTIQSELKNKFIAMTASEAKKEGRKVPIRDDWDKIKISVMTDILTDKFTRNLEIREKLIQTHPKYLEETNWWGDKFWGVCKGIGENNLGKILMNIRDTFITQNNETEKDN